MGLIRIMKKTYITPAIEEMKIETVEMIATSSMDLLEEEMESTNQLGTGRRGSWGNRWE